MFTSSEYFDMLVLYGQCDESATVTSIVTNKAGKLIYR
jgi:hypothetical protein